MFKVTIPYIPTPYDTLRVNGNRPRPAVIVWIFEHCPSFIRNSVSDFDSESLKMDYYFFNNEDAIMFKLTWS